jgi:hypothetical protein
MENIDVTLGKDHLEDIASAKPVPAIKEVIWNAFDSKSSVVTVDFIRNSITDTIEKIIIKDEGDGIAFNKVHNLFGSLGESWKKKPRKMVIILYMDNMDVGDLKPFH